MSRHLIVFLVGLALLGTVPVARAQAQECDLAGFAGFSYRAVLNLHLGQDCFRFELDNTGVGKHVRDILRRADALDPNGKSLEAFDVIAKYLDDELVIPASPLAANARELNKALAELKLSVVTNPRAPEPRIKERWQFSNLDSTAGAYDAVKLTEILTDDRCGDVASGLCDSEFQASIDLSRALVLINNALDMYTTDYRADVLADRRLRRTSWDSYYDDLTFQYPWELYANSLLLEWTDNREMDEGNKQGFRALPRIKLVLLHPEVNLVYADEADNEYDAGLSFELLGVEGFGFDKKGKVENDWGISLLAAYLERPDRAESSWTGGLMFKYEGYSLGITDNHGETGIVLNINLSQRLFDVKAESRHYYDEYEEKYEKLQVMFQ
jgi:hypothetical protein